MLKRLCNLESFGLQTLVSGWTGSAIALHTAAVSQVLNKPILLLLDDKEQAAYLYNDVQKFLGENNSLFYPASYRRPYQSDEVNNANVLLRVECINKMHAARKPFVMITYPEAVFEKIISKKAIKTGGIILQQGQEYASETLNEKLFELNFKRVDFVTEPGEFSLRGGILDVFSFSNDEPYRIEFFGDEIDSIRSFDIETQLSIKKISKIHILSNIEEKQLEEQRVSVFEHLPKEALVFCSNPFRIAEYLQSLYDKADQSFRTISTTVAQIKPEALFLDKTSFQHALTLRKGVEISSNNASDDRPSFNFQISPQPVFHKNFDLLIEQLNANTSKKYENLICCASEKQAKRLSDIFSDHDHQVEAFKTPILSLYEGFVDHDLKLACYTDHQIFERYHKFHLKDNQSKRQNISLKEFNQLQLGDYVTHIDHGIGKYGGLQKIDINGTKQEAIKLIYGDRDILYVSIHSLHKISKYQGKDSKPPKLYKLGSDAWKKLKQKTKTKVKKIAFDLIKLYAKRKMQVGFACKPDSYLQHELEASFLYEDTPDQTACTEAVKADMESDRPMDRLICGDVGFGKTEIAIRAAFKMVDNGKQVAILVPTTILAFQHYKTFTDRLKDFPVRIDYLNRFKSTKEANRVKAELESGSLDIIIGTHQLVNKSIKFKDLGLLVIDEEQKFGVGVKEKLKTIKANVDTLTLTATPIPRTLQFSLMAARDLSVMRTPPPNRYPIETRVIRFSEEIIRDAIIYEIQRSGQVFFVHNRIENIAEVAGMIQRLVPDAKVAIGHGQMEGKKLEKLMLGFMEGEFDVLVSTNIIESGLDVPNANTIIINNANNFGLSDLHQMRGRVGRSNKKAFCYFITPPHHVMSDDARKRIQALEKFRDLGSGFHIAMKDLEIRGSGDLLGGEQSGFINEIGFDTYQKILDEAILELKENEFSELYQHSSDAAHGFVQQAQIDTDIQLQFPDDYVNSVQERLQLYTDLSKVEDETHLTAFEHQLIDRFGSLPQQVTDLLNSVRLKWMAESLGIERLILKSEKMLCYFVSNQQSAFYESAMFTQVLTYIQHQPNRLKIEEKLIKDQPVLRLKVNHISSVDDAMALFKEMLSGKS